MGQYAQPVKSQNGVVTIDWMVMAVACIAVLFLIGTMIRISDDAGTIIQNDGFHELGDHDQLLVFQDFSFDAAGWSPAATNDALPGLGPVLGPFTGEAVQRSFEIPANSTRTHLSFDLHLIGDWTGQGNVHVSVGGEEVLTIRVPGVEDADGTGMDVQMSEMPNIRVVADLNAVTPRAAQEDLPGANDDFVTLRIAMQVKDPAETLVLRLMAEAEGNVRWTLDNLTVVATSADGVSR